MVVRPATRHGNAARLSGDNDEHTPRSEANRERNIGVGDDRGVVTMVGGAAGEDKRECNVDVGNDSSAVEVVGGAGDHAAATASTYVSVVGGHATITTRTRPAAIASGSTT